MIKGEINFFDNIDYNNILINIIKNKLNPDRTLMGLLHKLLKAGYLENPSTFSRFCSAIATHVGRRKPSGAKDNMPIVHSNKDIIRWKQDLKTGYILSPIIYNLYLTLLDDFIEKLKKSYDKVPGRNIYYVRYIDSWVIGVMGPYHFASKIKDEIYIFIKDEFKIDLNSNAVVAENLKIVNLKKEFLKFLGYYLKLPPYQDCPVQGQVPYKTNSILSNVKSSSSSPLLLIPLNELKLKLIKNGFADDSGRPKYVGKYLFLSDYEIVKEYNRVLLKILTFYSLASNYYRLSESIYILEFSLAHTLAAKHRISLPSVFNKYGRPFVVTRGESDIIKFAKPESLSALPSLLYRF